jgi:hypothetical protein
MASVKDDAETDGGRLGGKVSNVLFDAILEQLKILLPQIQHRFVVGIRDRDIDQNEIDIDLQRFADLIALGVRNPETDQKNGKKREKSL